MFKNKRGQITLFVIIAILIVGIALIFFLWIKPNYIQSSSGKPYLDQCVEDSVNNAVLELGKQGGYKDPEFSYLYQSEKTAYLCYTEEYYKQCIVQEPFLIQHFKENLKSRIQKDVESCYENSVEELRREGYDVSQGIPNFEIELQPAKTIIQIQAPTTVTKETAQKFNKINVEINSPIYNILMIATSVLQQEAKYGDSDVTSMMVFYPDLIINKLKQGEGTKIYIIEDKQSKIKFQFASRSLVFPPGYNLVQ